MGTGCETDPAPLGLRDTAQIYGSGCSRESSAMDASPTERRRVRWSGLRVVNRCQWEEEMRGVCLLLTYLQRKNKLFVSSGKTNRTNVIRNHWA